MRFHTIIRQKSTFAAGRTIVLVMSLAMGSMAAGSNEDGAAEDDEASDPHAHHRQMMKNTSRYVKSVASYVSPDVPVLDRHGDRHSFEELMASDSPLVLNFIFTTCTTICPVLSATFSQAQEELQEHSTPPIMISISIDPDHDTPERLADYADAFHAGPDWLFLTGSKSSLLEIQKSFDAYRGDKLNHVPLTFLRASPNSTWTRLEGFTSAHELNEEYEELISDPQG
jgi:protein SCO1/2